MSSSLVEEESRSPCGSRYQGEVLGDEGRRSHPAAGVRGRAIVITCLAWAGFQLWIASDLPFILGFGLLVELPKRAIHLGFALVLAFLIFPGSRRHLRADRAGPIRWALVGLAVVATGYLALAHEALVGRQGILLEVALAGYRVPIDFLVGLVGIALLLEATRRAIGLPLVLVAGIFLAYSVFGQSMPELISHRGVSFERLIGYQWFTSEAIFGIPLDVSVSFVFLFVLFGALLERAGAGRYFLDLAFSLVGRYRGGPAKAAILSSAMTGMISGSSIANVVTTGTFTIPVMKRAGMPAIKAGAIEVAASTNGQLMPPIMGAAAFIIAEFIGVSYFDVVAAAAIPAAISYLALLYLSHLEALKLGLTGLEPARLPRFVRTFVSGVHFWVPIGVLLYLLMVERWTPGTAVLWSILTLTIIMLGARIREHWGTDPNVDAGASSGRSGRIGRGVRAGLADISSGLIAGSRAMVPVAVAIAAAGIIVGAVASTGLSNAMVHVVEALAGGNVYLLVGLSALMCLILGMGLPTTANYLVVASLLAGVMVELGAAAGLELPLIAVHLFVFYFGLLADSTPPVCLAAYAASGISGGDPFRTGLQSFFYDMRTAILPFVFLFNPALLLIGVQSFWEGALVFTISLLAILTFTSATQGWLVTRCRWWEVIALLAVSLALFRPDAILDRVVPSYAPVELAALSEPAELGPPGARVRFHVTRETEYGERFKLFVLRVPSADSAGDYGVSLVADASGHLSVDNLTFQGPAERAGMDFGDRVTQVEVEQLGRPAKEWVWPLALLVLVGLVWRQGRWRAR